MKQVYKEPAVNYEPPRMTLQKSCVQAMLCTSIETGQLPDIVYDDTGYEF